MVCEFKIYYVGEALLHELSHDLAEVRRLEIFAVLNDILMRGDCRYRGSVGRRTAYALFLHSADERCLGVSRGRLRELLLGEHFFEEHLLALFKRRQLAARLVALFVLALLIHRRIAGKAHLGVVRAKIIARRGDVD